MENLELSYTADGNVKWHSHLENSLAVPQNFKHEIYDGSSSAPSIYLREMKVYVHTKTCTRMFTAALFTTAKKWKESKSIKLRNK